MASTPASNTNVSRRRAERGEDGAAWASTGSGPSVINSCTIVCSANSWAPTLTPVILAKSPWNRGYISVMVTAVASGHWTRPGTVLVTYLGDGSQMWPAVLGYAGVKTGGEHDGTAVGGGEEIGAGAIVGLVGDAGPRGDRADLYFQGFQRGLRIHVPRRPGGRKARPSPGMAQHLQDGGGGAGHPRCRRRDEARAPACHGHERDRRTTRRRRSGRSASCGGARTSPILVLAHAALLRG